MFYEILNLLMTHQQRKRIYTSDNKMYAFQTGLERKTKSLDNLTFHYHNYDRKYYVQGKKDKYYSESLVTKFERDGVFDDKFSYGFGSEYKYDWGHYQTDILISNKRTRK